MSKTNLEAIVDSTADAICEFSGVALTRTTEAIDKFAVSVRVESTQRFPSSGYIKINNEIFAYTGKSSEMFVGLSRAQKFTNVSSHAANSIVQDYSRKNSTVARAFREFCVDYAEGMDLDTYGRNFGIDRYFIDVNDDQFRAILKGVIISPRLTLASIETVLDAVYPDYSITDGTVTSGFPARIYGNFDSPQVKSGLKVVLEGHTEPYVITTFSTYYIDLGFWRHPATAPTLAPTEDLSVVVKQYWYREFPYGEGSTIEIIANKYFDDPLQAQSFVNGGEYLYPTTTHTFTTTHTVNDVNGIWLATDTYRTGTNYASLYDSNGQVTTGLTTLTTSSAIFQAGDVGKYVKLSGSSLGNSGTWKISAFGSSTSVTLSGFIDYNGTVVAAPVFTTESGLVVELIGAVSYTGHTITIRNSVISAQYLVEYGCFKDTYVFNTADEYSTGHQFAFYLADFSAVSNHFLDYVKKAGLKIRYLI